MIIFIKLRDGTELNIEDASEYGMVMAKKLQELTKIR